MSIDHTRRFAGVARLYGITALERFTYARVCVVGVGGVGAWAVEALARSGIGHLTLIDLDHIAESNINRQLHALTDTLGQAKVIALVQRILGINPDATVLPVEAFIEPDNLAQLLDLKPDFLLDCIDGSRNKAALIAYCHKQNIPLVSVGGAGGRRDPTRLRVADLSRTVQDSLLAKTRQHLRTLHGFPRDPRCAFQVPCVYSEEPCQSPPCANAQTYTNPVSGLNCAGYGSVVTVTAAFGLTAAALVLNALAVS